jgi:hypothetical protein
MSEQPNGGHLDLGCENVRSLAPVPRLVHLILQQAVLDGVVQIEFCLADELSIKTINPMSEWLLESEDLHQRLRLSKT